MIPPWKTLYEFEHFKSKGNGDDNDNCMNLN